jgi:hypothetical protein
MAAVGFSYFSENSLFFTNPPPFFWWRFSKPFITHIAISAGAWERRL